MATGLLIFFILLSAYLARIAVRQRHALKLIGRKWSDLQTEEERVFDFLHSLGEAFGGSSGRRELYRLIVESAARILLAHGGALYLADRSEKSLTPVFVSRGCAPLVELPPHIREQTATNPVAMESYLRLHTIRPGEGVVGRMWEENGVRAFSFADPELQNLAGEGQQPTAALAGCLSYKGKVLGVLAVVNGPMSNTFSPEDLVVFQAIADQSAFALYSEAVYAEAGEKRRLDRDIATAREIQSILLPTAAPVVAGYEIAGLNIPARHVSGDYFDYLQISDHLWGVAIADVAGKGIPAAMVTSMCRAVLHMAAPGCTSPAAALRQLNQRLYPDVKEDLFISMLYLLLDTRNNEVTIARAGHDPPLIYRTDGHDVTQFDPPGMAVGIDSGNVFDRVLSDATVTLAPGDGILLYTDGATEALDRNDAEFGMVRLTQTLQANAPKGAEATVRAIADDVRDFADGMAQHDDITLIFIRKT